MAIQYYYSPSTKGIYSAEVHGTAIPTDRVTITPTQYAQVAAGTYSVTVVGGVATTVAITPQTAGADPKVIVDSIGIGNKFGSITIADQETPTAGTARFLFGNTTSGYGALRLITNSTKNVIIDAVDWATSATQKHMCLQPNGGNIGLGTATPSAKLYVVGESYVDYANEAGITGGALRLASSINASSVSNNEYYDGLNRFTRTGGSGKIRIWQTNDAIGGAIDFLSGKTGPANTPITYTSTMMLTSDGNVGIGTQTPGLKFDVAGGIRASLKVIAEEAFALAPTQLYTTQRTFTQVINTTGSNYSSIVRSQVIAGQTWLLGTFSQVTTQPAMFKFVHNTHTGSNLQSDSYEWSRTYMADPPASDSEWSDWVELPVTTSVMYTAARQFRFDVRAKYQGVMELRLRASTPSSAYDGNHYFTFTTTGMANYTPETVFNVATAPAALPTGFHGRQAYEFPVSKGNYGFSPSTAGLFILNNGNVGISTTTPEALLEISGTPVYQTAANWSSATSHTSRPHLLLRTPVSSNTIPEIQFMEGINKSWVLGGAGGANATFTIRDDFQSGNPVRLAIMNNGNVGIGTTTPQGKLEVWNGATYLNNGSIDGTYGDQIFFGAAPSGYGTTYLHKIKTSHSVTLANSLMTFSLDNGASTTVDVLTLSGTGNVSSSAAPTTANHLCNKTYVDSLSRVGSTAIILFSGAGNYTWGDETFTITSVTGGVIDGQTQITQHIKCSSGRTWKCIVDGYSFLAAGTPIRGTNKIITITNTQQTVFFGNSGTYYSQTFSNMVAVRIA